MYIYVIMSEMLLKKPCATLLQETIPQYILGFNQCHHPYSPICSKVILKLSPFVPK